MLEIGDLVKFKEDYVTEENKDSVYKVLDIRGDVAKLAGIDQLKKKPELVRLSMLVKIDKK